MVLSNLQEFDQSEIKVIYNYFGLELFFNLSDTQPLVIYAKNQNSICKLRICLKNGVYEKNEILTINGIEPLNDKELENFLKVVEFNLTDIIKSWLDCFVYNKEDISFEKILKPIS